MFPALNGPNQPLDDPGFLRSGFQPHQPTLIGSEKVARADVLFLIQHARIGSALSAFRVGKLAREFSRTLAQTEFQFADVPAIVD